MDTILEHFIMSGSYSILSFIHVMTGQLQHVKPFVCSILCIKFYKEQQEHISPALHSQSVQRYLCNPLSVLLTYLGTSCNWGTLCARLQLSDYYSKTWNLLSQSLVLIPLQFHISTVQISYTCYIDSDGMESKLIGKCLLHTSYC